MAYDSTVEYINRDKVYNFCGIDLNFELKDSATDNPTQKVVFFCKNLTTWTYAYFQSHFDINDDNWTDALFTEALLWQVKYVLKHGENEKLSDMTYNIMHENGIINPSQQERIYRYY